MRLFDNLILNERVQFPDYTGDESASEVWWQTKSLTFGQDRLRRARDQTSTTQAGLSMF